MNSEVATLGGGCFWCLEAVFELLEGVQYVQSGYAGGRMDDPTYEQVCGGNTGHAEVVQITFDPAKISYHDLLVVFFSTHDPTTLNRQGADVGTQYRSVIYTHSAEQKQIAVDLIRELQSGDKPLRIVTEVIPAPAYFPAEDYHQGYYRRNPNQGYCQAVVGPKVAKLRKQFTAILARGQ